MWKMIYTLMLCFSVSIAWTQTVPAPKCGTESAMKSLYSKRPQSLQGAQELNEFSKRFREKRADARTMASTYTIPVVFHVFGTDFAGKTVNDNTIITALQKVNEDFNGLNDDFGTVDANFLSKRGTLSIEFKLAKIDPLGNPTTGIKYYPARNGFGNGGGYDDEIQQFAWDNYKYMNVYIQLDLYNDGSLTNSGVAWYPDQWMSDNNLARVVYNGRYLYGNTDKEFASVLSHEFGHYLNLIHTFEGGCTYPNDQVTDTPPTSTGAGCSNVFNCEGVEINGENYMDYNVSCYKMFTQGQVSRMTAALQHSTRYPLWQPANLVATGVNGNVGPHIAMSETDFREAIANNGTISTVSNLTINGDSWSASSGVMTQGTHYTVANVPAGLTVRITRLSSTTARVELIGTASAHALANSISNLQITFLNAALASNNANALFNKTLTYKVTYIDPYRIVHSTTFGADNDLIVTSANPWEWFSFGAGNGDFGGWYDGGKLRFETYQKAAVSEGSTRNITPIAANTDIGPASNWVVGGAYPDEHDIRSASYTLWDGRTAFIGVRFSINGNTNYGWVKASVSSNGSTLTLLEYAYNEAPNAVIKAGQTTNAGDTQAPSAPTNLAASNITSNSVQLSWTASTDNVGVTGYDIYRGSTLHGSSTTTTFTASGLASSTSYTFTVRAKDATGNVSASSNAVTVTTAGDTQAPSAPTNLAASNITSSSVQLSWTASTDNVGVTAYDIYRGSTLHGSSTSTSFNASGLSASTTYSFHVRARDAAGNTSAAGNSVTVTTTAGTGSYCTVSNGSPAGQYVKQLTFGSINNSSTYVTGGYSNFTNLSASVQRGTSVALTVVLHATWAGSRGGVWIDWNNDKDWNDAGEQVLNRSGSNATNTYTATVVIPPGAATGAVRMRVRAEYGLSSISPCGNGWHSEVEDYTVNISASGPTSDEQDIAVFPNPNNGKFVVQLYQQDGDQVTLNVMNSSGALVKQQRERVKTAVHRAEVDLQDVPRGLYFIAVSSINRRSVHKIIIE